MAQPYSDYSDFARAFEELTTRSVADQVLVAQRLRDLLQQVAAGEVDLVTLRSQYDRLVTEQAAQLTRDLTTLGVRYYETMLDLNRAYAERLFDDLSAAAGLHNSNNAGPAPPAEPPPAPAVVELRLRGKAGDWIEDGFVVENKRSEPSQIAFLLSEFTGDGVEPFRPAVKLEPPRLELDPHEEATVMLRLELDRESFKPGVQYHAQLLVRGTDELELRLVVDVDEPAPPPPPKAAPKPRSTARKKRAAS